ncbi:MAG TPA: Gfo/Idh/MocA family oxidoreductase, partial [Candidatus Latescibacteria bacterium]|nr:Gfo/Idh/MocA family oxidoreductase [Candidatus Latescibacterota bacterium]
MEKVQVGVIGCGSIGTWHIERFQKAGAEVVAICDIRRDRLEQVKADYKVPKSYIDYEDLLARKEVDAVVVALPTYLHKPVTVAAFEVGKHVLCEKPAAMNTAEVEEMLSARDQAGKKLLIGLTQRFRNSSHVLKEHIEAGELGEVYYAKCGYLRRSGIPGMGSWFTRRDQAGAGAIFDIGVHALDLAMWLMGEFRPKEVLASSYAKFGPLGKGAGGWGFPEPDGPFDVEDLGSAFIKMESGATVFLEVSWAAHIGGGQFYVTLLGDRAGADWGSLTVFGEDMGHQVDKKLYAEQNDPYLDEARHFLGCVRDEEEALTRDEEILGVQMALDAV